MTQEEKAKAYDEVRKKIAIRFGSNVADEIFSQFEMSEDERIRKWLINLVKGHIEWLEDRIREQLSNGQVYGDELVKAKNSLAWLEKQGEQKPFDYENANIQQKDFEPKSAMEAIKGKNTDNANKVEPNDYSRIDPYFFKPVDKVEPKFKIGDFVRSKYNKAVVLRIEEVCNDIYKTERGGYIRIEFQDDWELMEEKPAWSEEDEERLSDAIFFVREYQIPTRDKRLLNAAKGAEDWLKSLRPQNTWKPSEEQFNNTSCTHLSKEEAESKVWKQ